MDGGPGGNGDEEAGRERDRDWRQLASSQEGLALCAVSARCDRGWTEHLHHLIYDPLCRAIRLDDDESPHAYSRARARIYARTNTPAE